MALNVSPIIHIEIVVNDADEAYQFLRRVFGAKRVQEKFSNFIEENLGGKIVHVALGGVVLQFVEPTAGMDSWSKHLKEKGPGVHNLTFGVDNLPKAVNLLEQEGSPVVAEFSIDWSKLIDIEKPKTEFPGYIINSMEKVGFNLELVGKVPEEVEGIFGE